MNTDKASGSVLSAMALIGPETHRSLSQDICGLRTSTHVTGAVALALPDFWVEELLQCNQAYRSDC
jgi:hypothetical protein